MDEKPLVATPLRRILAALLLVAALPALVACGTETAASGEELGDATSAEFFEDWPAQFPSTTSTSTTTTTVPELPTLPVPDPLPLDAHQPDPEVHLGTVSAPRLGLQDVTLHVGVSLTVLNRGPGWWPGTARPGQVGRVVIAGHRTTYSKPFHNLDLVVPGDEMVITTDEGRFVYRATHTEIVTPDALWIAHQDYGFTLATFACHPKGSARQRIVVFWQLVDESGEPVPPLA